MRRYADYVFYDKEYEGTLIPSESFIHYIQKASFELDSFCLNLNPSDTSVKFAACEIAEINYKTDNNLFVSSESVGRMSKSYYQSQSAIQLKQNVINKYLPNAVKSRWV